MRISKDLRSLKIFNSKNTSNSCFPMESNLKIKISFQFKLQIKVHKSIMKKNRKFEKL